jgi:DNA damage-binding protein 1
MALNYVVSAQKATAVSAAVVGSFTGENDLNLIVGRTNRLEMLLVTAEGLKPHLEVPIFGRIAALKVFRARHEAHSPVPVLEIE